jgi:fimbrial isopeptide formation D2 family protein/LPXTG-motif cell wall-anchored protein
MKKMKKVMALLLSLVMVLAMSVVAFATEEGSTTSGTYTITAPATSHQYEIYQIFTGDLHEGTLSNLKWGKNGKETEGTAVAADVVTALTGVTGKSFNEILAVVEPYANLNSTPIATVTNGATYEAVAGYYLIKDKDNSVTGTDSYTLYIVKVVGNVTIDPKSDVPSFEKKIKDTNDTEGTTTGWQDSADYDIGDNVPFKLEGTVAANYAQYKQYYFAFHDNEEEGLSFNKDSVRVYVDNTEITEGYTVVDNPADGCTFEVVFNDLMAAAKEYNFTVGGGSKIRVEYTSKLNEKAKIGKEGNVNSASLEFSNNPNQEQGGTPDTGNTPWDNVIVFTYKVVVNKIDSSKKPLAGAAFELSKKVNDEYTRVALVNATQNTEGKYTLSNETVTKFEWKGLDDGDYMLTEVITPAGYNTIAPIKFTVNADHTITWEGENRNTILTSLTGNAATGDITFTANDDKTELATNVVNNKGSELPTTGGMGTTIFYVVGSILVLGAAILLITKKRMSAR